MQNARPSIGYHKYSNTRNMCLDAAIASRSRAPRVVFLFFCLPYPRWGTSTTWHYTYYISLVPCSSTVLFFWYGMPLNCTILYCAVHWQIITVLAMSGHFFKKDCYCIPPNLAILLGFGGYAIAVFFKNPPTSRVKLIPAPAIYPSHRMRRWRSELVSRGKYGPLRKYKSVIVCY